MTGVITILETIFFGITAAILWDTDKLWAITAICFMVFELWIVFHAISMFRKYKEFERRKSDIKELRIKKDLTDKEIEEQIDALAEKLISEVKRRRDEDGK